MKIAGRPSTDNDGSWCEVTFLDRVLRVFHSENRQNFEIEGDVRHAALIASELGLTSEKTKTVDTPQRPEGMECWTACLAVVVL